MPTLDQLTLTDINKVLNAKSLAKSRGYVERVRQPTRIGSNTLTAQVVGSRTYEVEIEVETGLTARCSCPYTWGGYCKHVGAVLLKWLDAPAAFAVKEAVPTPQGYPIPVFAVDPPPTARPKERPFWLGSTLAERHQAERLALSQYLQVVKLQDLRDLAQKRGWKIKGTKKADLAGQMVDLMADPGGILKASLGLDAEHRRVLQAMLLFGDEKGLRSEDVARAAEQWGKLTAYKQIGTYINHLAELGLAQSGWTQYGSLVEQPFIPTLIARRLPPALTEVMPTAADLPADQSAADLRLADPLGLTRLANQVSLLLEQTSPPLRIPHPRPQWQKYYPGLADWDYDPHEIKAAKEQNRLQVGYSDFSLTVPPPAPALPPETVARLAPLTGGEAQLEFIFALLVAAGLFQPGSPVTLWPEVKEQFLRLSEPAQQAVLARVYFLMMNWSELWPVLQTTPNLRLKRSWYASYYKPENLRVGLTLFRRAVLRVLAGLPDNRWVNVTDLWPLLRGLWPRFDQVTWAEAQDYYYSPPNQRGAWFLARADTGQPLDAKNEADWRLAQGNFIRQIITGPLHWLGLADLLFDRQGELAQFRLRGLADLWWDRVETPALSSFAAARPATDTPPADAVTTDHHTITVNPAAISAQAHSLLDKIARLDEMSPGRFTYTLHVQAAHAAFEDGHTLADLLADWARLLGAPVSAAIHAQLTAWWQAYGQVRLYQDVTVLEFSDDFALTEMKAVTTLADHLVAEISPRLVLVHAKAVDALITELEKAGYTPTQTDEV